MDADLASSGPRPLFMSSGIGCCPVRKGSMIAHGLQTSAGKSIFLRFIFYLGQYLRHESKNFDNSLDIDKSEDPNGGKCLLENKG